MCERTRDVTRYQVREGRPLNRGVDVEAIERADLERSHASEFLAAPRGPAAEAIRRRPHEAERQAFEQHAAEQRQVFEQRMQKKRFEPPRGSGERKANPRGKGGKSDD
jgi:hypothetical protein